MRKKTSQIEGVRVELYNFLVANRGDLGGQITKKDVTIIMTIKQVLEIGKN